MRGLSFAEDARRFRLRVGEHRIEGFAFGETGPSVALVHGWGGAAAQLTAFVSPLRALGFRVLAFDAPGHGSSGGNRATIKLFADSLDALAHAHGAPVAVIAHSLGCAAATVAMARGLAVQRAVFLSPFTEPRAAFEKFARVLGLELGPLSELAERRYSIRWSDFALFERARELEQPLLVFHDRADRAVALGGSETLVGAWPGAELLVSDGLGHQRILRDPEIVARAAEFLRPLSVEASALHASTSAKAHRDGSATNSSAA
jgi:pimeloyl-ACP methyl ester carboxylesterase